MSGPPGAAPAATPPAPPARPPATHDHDHWRSATPSLLAGVGVLLLAMGVGVLIGRSGGSKASNGAPQVISVASTPSSSPTASQATFTSDWPSTTSGYTVQLQTLPQEGTSPGAVESAKSAAAAKGAKDVGALSSEDFSSLPSGRYVVYSGVFHDKAQAQKALAGLRAKFPAAKVIKVSSTGSGAEGAGGEASSSGAGASGSGGGSSLSKPAPPSVLESVNKSKGKSYVEKAKNLPDVVSTG